MCFLTLNKKFFDLIGQLAKINKLIYIDNRKNFGKKKNIKIISKIIILGHVSKYKMFTLQRMIN